MLSPGQSTQLKLRLWLSEKAFQKLAQFPANWPRIEYVIAENLGPDMGRKYALIYTVMVAPISRWNVTIQSNDTSDQPLANPN